MATVEIGDPQLQPSRVSTEKPFVSIVIPAYNEEAAIGEDIDKTIDTMKVSGYPFEVIVVDDGSTDATRRIAEEHEVRVIVHPYNKGGGAARKTGIRHARGEIIAVIDGDASYPAHDIPKLLDLMENHDMVIGARTCENGTLKLVRKPVKTVLRLLAGFVAGRRIPDLNSGMRAFRKDVALQYFNILPDGHSWVSTISLAFLTNGYSVKYVPIDYYRRKGKSTFRPIRDSASMALLICTTIMYFRPLRFFLPAGFLLLATGLVRAVYDAKMLYHVKESDIVIVLTAVIIIAIGLLADLIVKMNRARA
jgi:glycosyltransferase involved in cell wall biosynthesis